ncbi:MAG: endo-1,4-beta-xylanase [Desulfobacteraceae bacterium]|nr:endo-1,4-beta-xylanase [Desulfobacteraceae bacterium]
MKRILTMTVILFFVCMNFVSCNNSSSAEIEETEPTDETGLTEPAGRRLRTIVEDKYSDNSIIIGGTTGSWALHTDTGTIMNREFSYLTPENDFKQGNIHPDNSTWNWEQPDAWIAHIAQSGQVLRMHCPIGPQCSNWADNDSRTASELETNLEDFMQAVCERYNAQAGVEYMDVVNETVINGSWFTDKTGYGWENPWYKIGQDTDENQTPLYIPMAFEIANDYAPDIKLIYNHHEQPAKTDSWSLIKETISYLKNQDLRVDGIGWQAHVAAGWESEENIDSLRDLIDWAHSNDLEFHITEASVWLKQGNSETYLEQQANTYRAILDVLLEKRSAGKVGWNTWHIYDGSGWHTDWYPSLFDAGYAAKPAYYAIQDALENAP